MTINAKRLLKLADYLETVPREQFSMSDWKVKGDCGFAGCAIGWAIHGKLFRGLKFEEDDFGFFPAVEDRRGWSAVSHLFSIHSDDAENKLFGALCGKTPKQVAKRIRKFVAANQVSK